jgi:hypothetical protein
MGMARTGAAPYAKPSTQKGGETMQPYSPRLAAVLVCLFVLASIPGLRAQTAARAPATQPYSFGVVPQQSATRLARDWLPFLKVLSARSGIAPRATAPSPISASTDCGGWSWCGPIPTSRT